MNTKNILAIAALLPMSVAAQTICFEEQDYKGLDVYDSWTESPFRTGELPGNYGVIDNHLKAVDAQLGFAPNSSRKILGLQRSRFGSNTFGVRIDLNQTFELTTTTRYIHVMVNRPYSGRMMVIGLGKRQDRLGQSPETEQFWALSSNIPANRWEEVVLPIKGNGDIDIYSLVVVPDCESTHDYTTDQMCYIDNIEINSDAAPRFSYPDETADKQNRVSAEFCRINNANRNGEVLAAADKMPLNQYKAASGKPFRIYMNPEKGFEYAGILVRYGHNLNGASRVNGVQQWQEVRFGREVFDENDEFELPASCMVGDVLIEGLFVEESSSKK